MNWSRSSKLALALVLVVLATAVPAAAVSVSGDAPDTVKVGTQTSTTFTITEPFDEYEQWTLRGHTELTQVNWQVTTYDNADNQVEEQTFTGQSFSYQLSADSGVVRVEVKLVGTPAPVEDWSYDPPQEIEYVTFQQAQEGGATDNLTSMMARPYTEDSQAARTAIDEAKAVIERARSAGITVEGAASDLQDAIEFFNNGNFEQARENAEEARTKARNALQSQQTTNLLLLVAGVVVVLVLVAAGIWWYLNQRETYDRLG
ncbi:MAG: hypothetical protein ABEJ67_00845 [Halanaeroarchaeum sp.]